MNKLTLNQLLTDYFKETDTITVSAQELQNLLINRDNEIMRLTTKITNLKAETKNIRISNAVLAGKLERAEVNNKSTFTLDLKA